MAGLAGWARPAVTVDPAARERLEEVPFSTVNEEQEMAGRVEVEETAAQGA